MRHRVWLAPLSRDWSYDFTAKALAQHLADRFEIRIAYDRAEVAAWEADLYVDFWWKGRLDERHGRRVVKQVSSHRWGQPRYHRLQPKAFATKHLMLCGSVAVPSERLRGILFDVRPRMPPIAVCPKGFHPERMGDYGLRRAGELAVGWAGNASATDKRVNVLVEAWPRIRLADRCLDYDEMPDFYNSLDVITCASVAEGDPRPLIEGMACGCFPVTVDVGIVPELVEHGVNGLIVDRTPRAFRDALEWCSQNIDLVRAAGAANAVRMRETRTWSQASKPWGDMFQRSIEAAA